MSDPRSTTERQVRVRRGPKVVRFVAVGAGLGAILAFVDIGVTPKDTSYSTAQALGFIALVLVPVGAALGGAVAVLLDRISIRRSRIVTAERSRSSATPAVPVSSPPTDEDRPAQDGAVDQGA